MPAAWQEFGHNRDEWPWDHFDSERRIEVPTEPSPFARWVAENHPSDGLLVDLASGTGGDALWFAREQGRRVLAIDYLLGTVRRGNLLSTKEELPASFEVLNLYDTRSVRPRSPTQPRGVPLDLFARFTLHALDTPGQVNLLRLASMALRRGGFPFLEFRTPRNRRRSHVFGAGPDTTSAAGMSSRGSRVPTDVCCIRSMAPSLAPLGDEDPYVCRVVASWV